MQLYKMELYKLIHRKVFFTGLIAVVGIILIYFWFSVLGVELAVVDETTYMGYEAVQMNREITEEFAGIITDEKVELIVEKYGIPSKLVDGIPGWRDSNYLNDFVARYFTDGSWEQGIAPTTRYTLEESEFGKVCSRYHQMPVLAYTNGWKAFVEMCHFSLMLGSALLVCSISGVFAEEGTTKMLPLLFTTREGKGRDIVAKILAAFTLTLLLFVGLIALNFLLCKLIYGLDGFENMAAIVLSGSFRSVYMQDFSSYLSILLLYGIQGFLVLCSITLCVSAWYKNSFTAVIIAAVVWVIPVLLRILFTGFISLLIYATPIFLVMNGTINDSYPFWPAIVVSSVLIGTVCIVAGYYRYKSQSA